MEPVSKSPQITPPKEYPKIFKISMIELTSSSLDAHLYYMELDYKIDYHTHNGPLNQLLTQISTFIDEFLERLSSRERLFYSSDTYIGDILDDISINGKEGDIIEIELAVSYYFYIFGTFNNRNVAIIRYDGHYELPKEALSGLKYYNISQLRDFQNLYGLKNIKYIIIPRKYYPEELQEISENEVPFELQNREDHSLILDIGDGHILYVSPDIEYSKYFQRTRRLK